MPPKGKKKKGGYQIPEKFDPGFVVRDVYKKPWCLGVPIGQGGFGLIYIANRGEDQIKKTDDAEHVIKIEPKENGPLFCEIHFYTNCSKEEELKKFMVAKSLKHLAMPRYISSGTCVYNEKDFRFLVMDRYQTDLQRIVNKPEANNRMNSEIGVLCLMRQILLSLEYIHQRGYAHGDIKGANLMVKNDHEAFLVDFGLAFRFKRDNIHQKYEIKPERRHNGTIEYTSRDAHDGAQISRRSDLEILGYCVVHWSCGKLPWVDLIKNPVYVQESKKKSMSNVKDFLKNTLESVDEISSSFVKFMEFYLNEVNKLEFDTEPDYQKIHTKITDTLTGLGHSKKDKDNFYIFKSNDNKSITKSTTPKKDTKKATKKPAEKTGEENGEPVKKKSATNASVTPKPSKKRDKQQILEDKDVLLNESSESEPEIISPPAKRPEGRVLPKMFNDTLDEPVKKSPLIKIKPKQTKKTSKLLQSPQISASPYSPRNSPRINTPKRGAPQNLASNLVNCSFENNENNDVQAKENKKENEVLIRPASKQIRDLIRDDINAKDNDLNKSITQIRPVLVKKKKNKDARTISTQTENSYLQNIRNKIML